MRRIICVVMGVWVCGVACSTELRVATFRSEVTPPMGHPLCGGWIEPLKAVDDPLLAKGVVLEDGARRYVVCAVDWCLLQTGAYDIFRRKLAAAAGTIESRVTVHTVHQHNAPIADTNAELLLRATEHAPRHLDLEFLEKVTDALATQVREACGQFQSFTHVGHGKARVERFASNRRVRLADGAIHVRYSSTRDAVLQSAPEGLIDPWLRTVTLFDEDRPLVRMHYYASHPMSYYGDGRATSDTVGLARERLEVEEGVPQIYFTGCGGNITAGKYNDGSPQARLELTDAIHAAMRAAVDDTRRVPVARIDWRSAQVRFAPRPEPEWNEERARAVLRDTNAPALGRLKAALDLAWLERLEEDRTVEVARLGLGPVQAVHLPGESFIEYQLFAQSLRPDAFVAVAAYGESGPGYICTDAALIGGGYEPTMSRVGAGTEFEMKRAIAELLAPVPAVDPPFYPDKLGLLWWRDEQGVEHAVRDAKGWAKRRAHIVASLERVMGGEPQRDTDMGLAFEVIEELRKPGFTLRRITYVIEPGDVVPALLLIPEQRQGRGPALLCLHQTTAVGKLEPAGMAGDPELAYAAELAERGYVTLVPDYPNVGDSRVDPYAMGYGSATRKGVRNHQRGLDLLASLPEVDASRMGVIGHSLGGHNAIFLGVMDSRVRAVVTSCGFNAFPKYYGGDLRGWSHAGYMPRIATDYGCDPRRMPFDFTELLAALAPRPVFINAPTQDENFEVSGVHDCVVAARPVYRLFEAADSLVARHPEAGHSFPRETRAEAYGWLDRVLAGTER
jgi:dienelactone hydrolase